MPTDVPDMPSVQPTMTNPMATPRTSKAGKVSIVLPAKNEEAAIGRTLRALPLATLRTMGFETEVLVLDGQSTDRTAEIAKAWGAIVVTDRERGKGSALRNARDLFSGDYIVMLDADGTYAADAIPRVVSRLAFGTADVVMGRRIVQPGSMSRVHEAGNSLLSVGATVLYGRACPDLCTGLWGFRADAFAKLPLRARGFELEAELFALSSRLGLRIQQVRTDYLPRHGRAKLAGGPDGLRIGWWLLRSRFRSSRPAPASRTRAALGMAAEMRVESPSMPSIPNAATAEGQA
jgi:glycosyltransferase involved in cell wall biosynthesis